MAQILQTEVLIIGGGPSGMLCGIYLDKLGISSILVERRHEISDHPKAHELSARSIEILCQLGFTQEELKKEASPHEDASRILFCHTLNEELGRIDLCADGNDEKYYRHLASPEPYLNLSQTELERLMRARLQECEKCITYTGHQWEGMEATDSGRVSTILNRDNGDSFQVETKYVICADGAGSRSRKSLGINMIGEEKLQDFISAYFELNLRDLVKTPAKLYWMINPDAPGTFIAHHIEKRWVYHFPIFQPYEKKEDFTEEVLEERIYTALGTREYPVRVQSISLWRMTSQIAETFRKGPAFLVGDAAHRFPPTGGLGMNSGIGDAQNLCWKLAFVLRGMAPDSLLDTYEEERRPVVQVNREESYRNYKKIFEVPQALGLDPNGLATKAKVLNHPLVKMIPKGLKNALLSGVNGRISKSIFAKVAIPEKRNFLHATIKDQTEHFDRIGLDLGYYYERGALIPENGSARVPTQEVSEYEPSTLPGVRFPHFWIEGEGGKQSSHSLIHPQTFTLLITDASSSWWAEHVRTRPDLEKLVTSHNISPFLSNNPDFDFISTFLDTDKIKAVLIRPDGQVAWRHADPNQNLPDISAILSQILQAI